MFRSDSICAALFRVSPVAVARRFVKPRAALAISLASLVTFAAGAQDDDLLEPEVIDMAPDDAVGWSLRNVAAPIGAIFQGGLGYWYSERSIEIDTTPSGGFVDLFYVRRNFQKRFEQAQAPVTVLLPPRIKAGPRDALTVRAFHEGFRQQSITVPIKSRQTELVINLEPLPNLLKAVSHRYFAGRSTLVFLTDESPTFRLQDKKNGIGLILSETAQSAEAAAAIDGIASPMVVSADSQQIGEDFFVEFEFADAQQVEVRSRLAEDPARGLYAFSLDLIPVKGYGDSVASAQAALARLASDDVTGCRLEFDAGLRSELDSGALSRALVPKGAFTDPYLRAAMRRLGELSPDDGTVKFTGGVAYRPVVPIELEVALSQAAEAEGFLVLLREFVRELEDTDHQRETLRSLVAPEMNPLSFAVVIDKANAREKSCIAAQ